MFPGRPSMTFFSGAAFFLGGILGFFFARVGRVVVKVRTRSTGGRATVSMQETKGETEADSSNAAQTGSRYEAVTTQLCGLLQTTRTTRLLSPPCAPLLLFFCAFLLSQPNPCPPPFNSSLSPSLSTPHASRHPRSLGPLGRLVRLGPGLHEHPALCVTPGPLFLGLLQNPQ